MQDVVFAFLPWLRLEEDVAFRGFTFAKAFPLPNQVHEVLRPMEKEFRRLLKVFRDTSGRQLRSGTFVFSDRARGTLLGDEADDVRRLLGYLFLACYSRNEYFCAGARAYVNSAAFALYCCGSEIGRAHV